MKKHWWFVGVLALGTAISAQPKYVGWSTGYLAGWAQGSYPPSKVVWKAYTHMCHFSATPQTDGSCKLSMGINASFAADLVKTAHDHGVKAILCVGGAGTGSAFKGASSTANRAKFIKNMVALMQQYGYDGIDVDWEEGTGGADYIALHTELRAALDKITPRPLLTAAVAGYYSKDLAKVAQYCDQLNNMSYWTKAASIAGNMNQLVNMGIPKAKLGVGIGLDYQEGGNPEVDCDPVAAKAKAEFAVNNGYGGIMIWEIERDFTKYGATQPVHEALASYVNPNATPILERSRRFFADNTLAIDGSHGISYTVSSGAFVDLSLIDFAGARVKTLTQGRQAPGAYSIALDQGGAARLRPGAYIVQLTADRRVAAAQTLIIK